MLSVTLIEKMVEAGDDDRLVRDLTANGLELPLPLRVRLSACHAAGLGLGLRRLVELTYGPTALSRRMTADLLACQNPDGGFSDPRNSRSDTPDHFRGDALATATAAAALGRLLSDHIAHRDDPVLHTALDRALAALAGMQQPDGLIAGPGDRAETDRELTSAFILYLLSEDPRFRAAVRYADLVRWFEERQDWLQPGVERLWNLAKPADTAPLHAPLVAA